MDNISDGTDPQSRSTLGFGITKEKPVSGKRICCSKCGNFVPAGRLSAWVIYGTPTADNCHDCGSTLTIPQTASEASETKHGESVAQRSNRPSDAATEPPSDAGPIRSQAPPAGGPGRSALREMDKTGRGVPLLDNGAQSVESARKKDVKHFRERFYDDSISDGEVASRLKRFHARKDTAQDIGGRMLERGFLDDGGKVFRCCSDVTIRKYSEGGLIQVIDADFCQKRILCPNCERIRAARSMREWIPKILQVQTETEFLPMMVTLTVKNRSNLKAGVNHIFESLQKANQSRRDAMRGKGNLLDPFTKIQAAIWHLEVKRGKNSKGWHPHLHGLVLVPRDDLIRNVALSEAWKKRTCDSFIVDARLTNFGKLLASTGRPSAELFAESPDVLKGDLCEILKYCLKFDLDQNPDDVIDAHYALKNMRLARTWGLFRGLEVVDELENGVALGLGPYLDYVLKWQEFAGKPSRYELQSLRSGVTQPESMRKVDRETPYAGPCPAGGVREIKN